MTEELGPCPAGHTTTYIVEDVQVGVNLTATAFYGECECGWRGPIRYQSRQGAAIAWGIRAESAEVERLREENKRLRKQFGGTMDAILWLLSRSGMADSKEACEIRKFRNELARLPEGL